MSVQKIRGSSSRKEKSAATGSSGDLILAGRNIPFFVGIFTMTATWVGGGYINGTAEAVADPGQGLIWLIAPWGYAISLILGGKFFAVKMRSLGFTTMLDPFEIRYGKKTAALLFIPALIGEVFWSSAILTALGTTFGVVLGFDFQTSILISSAVAVAYTALGGLMAVAYTDVIQLFCILVGLSIAVPFVTDSHGGFFASWDLYKIKMGETAHLFPDLKFIMGKSGFTWIDSVLLLALGGIPWQVYFQRVLSAPSPKKAKQLSYIAAVGCIIMAIPSIWIGIAGATADWEALNIPAPPSYSIILPYVIQYLTPPIIATIGLSAVAAAVMSSVDSSILSASSMFFWNVYRPFSKDKNLDAKKIKKIVQTGILVVGITATIISLQVQSVYSLWFLCADLVYVVLFPQLTMALFLKKANKIGAISGFIVSIFLRIGGGEPTFNFGAFLPYPDENFPIRTFSMLSGLLTIIAVSYLTQKINPSIPLTTNKIGKINE